MQLMQQNGRRLFWTKKVNPYENMGNDGVTLVDWRIALLGTCLVLQYALGEAKNEFFDYRFDVKGKDPALIADFFGTEAAMEAYSIFPFVVDFIMRRGEWDDDGTYRVPIILGGDGSIKSNFKDGKPYNSYLSARIEFDDRDRDPDEPRLPKEEAWDKFSMVSRLF